MSPRILVVAPGPDFSVLDCYTGWTEALKALGCTVHEFRLGDLIKFYEAAWLQMDMKAVQDSRFRKALTYEGAIEMASGRLFGTIYQFAPEVILYISGMFINNRMLEITRSRGHKTVLLHTESPYEDGVQLERACRVDISLVNDPLNLESFRKASTIAYYQPHSYRPALHKPGPPVPELECDLAFIGTGMASRMRFFEAMPLDGIDLFLAGAWPDLDPASKLMKYLAHDKYEALDNEQAVDVYRSARCGINFYRREVDPRDKYGSETGIAMGPREVEMAATGLFFLRDRRPESDEVLGMLPAHDSPEHAADLLRYFLDHPDEKASLAWQARAAVADRTFENSAKRLLTMLDRL